MRQIKRLVILRRYFIERRPKLGSLQPQNALANLVFENGARVFVLHELFKSWRVEPLITPQSLLLLLLFLLFMLMQKFVDRYFHELLLKAEHAVFEVAVVLFRNHLKVDVQVMRVHLEA